MSRSSSLTLPYPTLCLVTDRTYAELSAKVAAAVRGGVNMVQLREKDLPAAELLDMAISIRDLTSAAKALFLVNDRVDVALAAGADGVQLGEDALSVEAVRRIAGDNMLIGRSVHSLQGAVQAQAQGADFLIVGTIFPTQSKPDAPITGVELLAQVAKSVSIPFLAIGGVTGKNVAQVLAQGATGAAVISTILDSPDARAAARDLNDTIAAGIPNNRVVSSR